MALALLFFFKVRISRIFSFQAELDTSLNTNTAKNVILFIGDGMSIVTVGAARVYKGQQEGRLGEGDQFNFEQFPHTGLAKVSE